MKSFNEFINEECKLCGNKIKKCSQDCLSMQIKECDKEFKKLKEVHEIE